MAKKSEQYKNEAYVVNYKEMTRKVGVLSRISVGQFLGTRPEGDPRVDYLAAAECTKNLVNVQVQALLNMAVTKLGIPREEFMQVMAEEMDKYLKAIETDLCVTGWDDKGNPILNLKAYAERTRLWPK